MWRDLLATIPKAVLEITDKCGLNLSHYDFKPDECFTEFVCLELNDTLHKQIEEIIKNSSPYVRINFTADEYETTDAVLTYYALYNLRQLFHYKFLKFVEVTPGNTINGDFDDQLIPFVRGEININCYYSEANSYLGTDTVNYSYDTHVHVSQKLFVLKAPSATIYDEDGAAVRCSNVDDNAVCCDHHK
jgi:hypothetical protein